MKKFCSCTSLFPEKRAVPTNKMQLHMTVLFVIGLLIASCWCHGERELPSEIVWHSLMLQNSTTVSKNTLNTPKELDGNKSDIQTDYNNVAGKTVLPSMMTGTDALKKSHIIFNAYTERSIGRNSSVTYTKVNATDGHPVNGTNGIYTARTPGFYGFIFHALTTDLKSVLPVVELRVNGITAATAAAFNGGTYKALTLIAGAKLKQDDCVSVFVVGDGPLFENVNNKRTKNRASFAGTLMI